MSKKRSLSDPTQPYPKNPSVTSPLLSTPSALRNYYRKFLDEYIVEKNPATFSQAEVKAWPDVDLTTPQGNIINDIAKKFIKTNRLGLNNINSVSSTQNPSYWWNGPSLSIPAPANPVTLGHELVHANDHQRDNLNAKVWNHLATLHTNKGKDFTAFGQAVKRIKDKIDPSQVFSDQYKKDLTRGSLVKDINSWRSEQQPPVSAFNPPKWNSKKSADNWSSTFNEITPVVTDKDPTTGVENFRFYLGGASEIPAFISERLHTPWQTKEGGLKAALQPPEAQFLYDTLGNMSDAYPASNYPTINNYIHQRRNSIDNAFGLTSNTTSTSANTPTTTTSTGNPLSDLISTTSSTSINPANVNSNTDSGTGLKKGGRVRKKNLLSRLISSRYPFI